MRCLKRRVGLDIIPFFYSLSSKTLNAAASINYLYACLLASFIQGHNFYVIKSFNAYWLNTRSLELFILNFQGDLEAV